VWQLAAIELHDELGFETNEIDDIVADGRLAAEFAAIKLTITKFPPKTTFLIGHVLTKLASDVMVHGLPPTPTLPHKGGGGSFARGFRLLVHAPVWFMRPNADRPTEL
jgi:hypothetical protein